MQQSPLGWVAGLLGIVLSMMCCLSSVGVAAFMWLRSESAPAPAVYTEPVPPYAPPMPPPPPTAPASGGGATTAPPTLAIGPDNPTRGPETAPVTIHVVSDFQCPFCARVEPTLAQLDAANPGQIRWVWHDYPLPFHQNAMPAAEAAREVRRQLGDEAFWRFHDAIFANNRSLDARTLEQLASAQPGLDVEAFRRAVTSRQHEPAVRADMAVVDAQSGGLRGTPRFLIHGVWLTGAQPFARFQAAVDEARAR